MTHQQTGPVYGNKVSFAAMGLVLFDHCGTHVDAFSHMDSRESAASIEKLPLELFYTDAVCVDFSDLGPGAVIGKADVQIRLERAGLSIATGDTFLMRTGHYYPAVEAERFRTTHERCDEFEVYMRGFPGLGREAAEWLADQGVGNLATEARSIDSPANERADIPDPFPAHQVCRDRRILDTENLTIPKELAGRRCVYIGVPLKIRGGTGSPIRAFAVLPDENM
jgi:kynurenine formamidase